MMRVWSLPARSECLDKHWILDLCCFFFFFFSLLLVPRAICSVIPNVCLSSPRRLARAPGPVWIASIKFLQSELRLRVKKSNVLVFFAH